jgi:hypothetical protein
MIFLSTVELPGQFMVWLSSPEGKFLKGRFVWVNWDVDELKEKEEEIKNSMVLKILLNGVPDDGSGWSGAGSSI